MTASEVVVARMKAGELMDWKKAWSASDCVPQWGHWILSKLHKNGEIHIAKWQRGDSGPPRPLFAWGSGTDAPKLKAMTRAQLSRRYRKRIAANNPDKAVAQSERKNLKQRTTPILDPIHAALLGYKRHGKAWIKKDEKLPHPD